MDKLDIIKAQSGDKKVLERLMMENQALVYGYVNKKHGVKHPHYDDLIQEGLIGLHHAIMNTNIMLKYEFSTYANKCIMGRCFRYLYRHSRTVSVPIHRQYGKDKEIFQKEISLDETYDEGDPIHTQPDTFSKSNFIDILTIKEIIQKIHIEQRKSFILRMFYGLTFNEIAKRLNRSEASVSLANQNAIKIVRKALA